MGPAYFDPSQNGLAPEQSAARLTGARLEPAGGERRSPSGWQRQLRLQHVRGDPFEAHIATVDGRGMASGGGRRKLYDGGSVLTRRRRTAA